MNLGAANPHESRQDVIRNEVIAALARREENFSRWVEHPTSSIVHHDKACCEEARLWFLAYARSMEIGYHSQFELKAPAWLSRLYSWGPSKWPIAWCEVVREQVLDCGAFAALAREVFKAQGQQAHPAQILIRYNETCTDHWKDLWKAGCKRIRKKEGDLFPWIGNELVYHEVCLIECEDGTAMVYDSTWGLWHEPHQRLGFGAVLALRTECPRLLTWGDKVISCGEWIEI